MIYQTLTLTKQEAGYICNNYPTLAHSENVWRQRLQSSYEYIVNLESRPDNQENLRRINEILNTEGPNNLK